MTEPAQRAEVAAARLLLEKLGVSLADLLALPTEPKYVPTFAEFVPQIRKATTAGSLKAYDSYWKRLEAKWPDRRLNEPTPLEFMQLAEELKANRIRRRNGRNGDGVVENFVGAPRRLYRYARAEGYIDADSDPSQQLRKPDRPDRCDARWSATG
jgi:hypothetical protein